jgi:hypothetical protein
MIAGQPYFVETAVEGSDQIRSCGTPCVAKVIVVCDMKTISMEQPHSFGLQHMDFYLTDTG